MSDYHDFVFKDGKLLGDFEGMYNKSDEIPWHQDKIELFVDSELLKSIINKKYNYITDLSCGLGYYLNYLHKNFGLFHTDCIGYDISPTCCEKAKKLFPYTFKVNDITKSKVKIEENTLVCLRGTLWYVFNKIDNVVLNINNSLNLNDDLIIIQNFPPLDQEFIGKDIFPNYEAIINKFESKFNLKKHIWFENKENNKNDSWFIGLFNKRGN